MEDVFLRPLKYFGKMIGIDSEERAGILEPPSYLLGWNRSFTSCWDCRLGARLLKHVDNGACSSFRTRILSSSEDHPRAHPRGWPDHALRQLPPRGSFPLWFLRVDFPWPLQDAKGSGSHLKRFCSRWHPQIQSPRPLKTLDLRKLGKDSDFEPLSGCNKVGVRQMAVASDAHHDRRCRVW